MLCCQVLLLSHISNNLSSSARTDLLNTFIPVSRQLNHISDKLPELFMEVVSLFIVLYRCITIVNVAVHTVSESTLIGSHCGLSFTNFSPYVKLDG